jgi:hypothetical protein
VSTVLKHAYDGDGTTDHTGRDRCRICGTPVGNERHLPITLAEVVREEARRAGEHDDGSE